MLLTLCVHSAGVELCTTTFNTSVLFCSLFIDRMPSKQKQPMIFYPHASASASMPHPPSPIPSHPYPFDSIPFSMFIPRPTQQQNPVPAPEISFRSDSASGFAECRRPPPHTFWNFPKISPYFTTIFYSIYLCFFDMIKLIINFV
jgi:hypothetical protein